MIKLLKFLIILTVLSCDEELITTTVAQPKPYYDKSKVCVACSNWNISNTFPSNSISSGTYTIQLKQSNAYSYPYDDGAMINIYNTGSSNVTIIVSGALHGNGSHEIKPGESITATDIFYSKQPGDDPQIQCYTSSDPYIEVRVNISSAGPGNIRFVVSGSSLSCQASYKSREWNLSIN